MTDPAETLIGDALVERIVLLTRILQARGVDIALSEMIDANQAAASIGLDSRRLLRTALRATLVKSAHHDAAFDAAFDRVFPQRVSVGATGADTAGGASLVERLATGGDLAAMATELVDEHGGLDGELRGERHHLQRVYRGADLARLMSEARKADPTVTPEELRQRIHELKKLIAADLRSQLGVPDEETLPSDLQDVDFLNASRAELEQIRDAVRPLARRLASRFALRRQRQRSGRVNLRRTTRRSLVTGGVPLDLVTDRPRAHRPELFMLCDISGSVADFSLFTLTLMSALSAELARTRSFVFVDAVDEITDLLTATQHGIEPWQIMRNTKVIGRDGHSDYGAVLRQFWEEVGRRDLRPASTVIITGDARTNHRPTEVGVLDEIARRCRRVYWLNPEPCEEWDTEDSEMSEYASRCTDTFQVRNLRQLMTCVERIL